MRAEVRPAVLHRRRPSRRSCRCRRRSPRRAAPTASAQPGAAGLQVAVGPEGRERRGRRSRGPRPARRARPGRRTGRRWWPAPRCRTARTARAGGRRPWRAARRPGRRSRPRSAPTAGRSTSKISASVGLEPVARRRAAEQVPVRAQRPPDLAGLRLGRGRSRPDAEVGERDAAGVQQAGDVVVGRDEAAWPGRANGTSSTSSRASTCPCGERIGRSRTASYSRRATARTPGSAGSRRSGCRSERSGRRHGRNAVAAPVRCAAIGCQRVAAGALWRAPRDHGSSDA